MCTVPCYMEVYFCTLLTRRAQMESSGKLTPTLIWLSLPPVSSCITLLNLIRLVWFGLVWQCPLWSFPHVIPNGAGWRSVLHRQRTGRIFAPLFSIEKKAFLLPCQNCLLFSTCTLMRWNMLIHWHCRLLIWSQPRSTRDPRYSSAATTMWRKSKHCTPSRQSQAQLDRGTQMRFLALLWPDSEFQTFLSLVSS